MSIRSWNPFIKLDIKVNSLFLQLGEVNMDLYVENLRVGTISISDNSKYVSLELPFGAFQDGTIQKNLTGNGTKRSLYKTNQNSCGSTSETFICSLYISP
jgi:hypothetical protein